MELTKKWVLYEVIRVLVVDHDSTSLKIVSKMLGLCGYEVIIANCAIDALRIVKENENDLHLILTEVHLPDMGRYELVEKIMEQTSKLPIVNDNEIAKLGCLFKGAMLYLVKPLTLKSIRNLWQFSLTEGRERLVSIRTPNQIKKESINENESDKNKENQLIRNEKKKWQRTKRKEQEVSRELEGDGIVSTMLKRPKLIWTEQLHSRFLQAIKVLGVGKAHPKEILQHMNVPGLRKEKVSSHLQKFRLSLKRHQDALQKKMSENSNLKDDSIQFPNQQQATNSPSLSHFGRQFPSNNLPSTSINSNLIGTSDMVSFESLTNFNMGNSCFSKAIPSQTYSVNSTQRRPFEDPEESQSWFECEREEITTSTIHLPSHVEDQHCMSKVDEGEPDGIFDIVNGFTTTLHDEDYYDDLWQ